MSSIIQKKAIGYWDFRSGSIDDLEGSNNGTFVSAPSFNRSGLVMDGVDDAVNLGNTGLTVKTVAIMLTPKSTSEDIADLDGGTHTIEVTTGTVTATGFSSPTIYVNGLSGSTLAANQSQLIIITTATGISASAFQVGTETTFFDGTISAVMVSADEFTATEAAELMAEMEDTVYPTKPSGRATAIQKPDLDDSALYTAFEMKKTKNTLVDLANQNTGTIYGTASRNGLLGYSMDFDGTDDYVTFGDTSTLAFMHLTAVFTVSAWIKLDDYTKAGTQTLLATASSSAHNGFALYYDTNNDRMEWQYYNGSSATTGNSTVNSMANNEWNHIMYVGDGTTIDFYLNGVYMSSGQALPTLSVSATSTTIPNLGRYQSSGYFGGQIADFEIYNDTKDQTWATAKYKSGARAIQYKTDYGLNVSSGNVSSGELENSAWIVDSGNWQIGTDTIDGVKVKVLKCMTDNGIIYKSTDSMGRGLTETEAAYGTWEFYWYQQDANNLFQIRVSDVPNATSPTGYMFRYGVSERFRLRRETSGALADQMYTAAGYFTTGVWYKMKITRSTTGVWTIYRDDVLVDVTGGIGTNPTTDNTHTTAKYFSIQARATDLIAFADVKGDHSFVKKLGVN